jgi:hypothetical protein
VSNVGESPVGKPGNDRRDQLGDDESSQQGERWSFHEKETVGPGNEDQSLRNLSDFEVDDHMAKYQTIRLLASRTWKKDLQLRIVVAFDWINIEFIFEESRLDDNDV